MTFLRRPLHLVSALLLMISPSVAAQQMVSVAGKEVNLRSGPGTNHSAEWIVSQGYPLRVVSRRGDWLQVSDFENDRGWIFRRLTSSTPYHIVKVKIANLRSSPSTRSRILAKLSYGDIVKTLGRQSGWVKVQREGRRGWVSRNLLWGW